MDGEIAAEPQEGDVVSSRKYGGYYGHPYRGYYDHGGSPMVPLYTSGSPYGKRSEEGMTMKWWYIYCKSR